MLIDQLTKGLIIPAYIPKVGDYLKVIPNFISFIFVKNYGAAWGIFENNTIFLSIMTFVGIAIIIAFYILRLKTVGNRTSMLMAVSVGLLIGGAVGNLADRLILGYVRDFINFEFISFPVFNFADIFLTFGIILLVVYMLFFYSKETENVAIKNSSMKKSQKGNKDKENITTENSEIDYQQNDLSKYDNQVEMISNEDESNLSKREKNNDEKKYDVVKNSYEDIIVIEDENVLSKKDEGEKHD